MTPSVLIVEDEQCIRDILTELFEVAETQTHAVATLAEAQRALQQHMYELIVTDIRLGGQRDGGLQVMAAAGLLSPDATVIALTAYPDDDNRHASLRLGATYFLEKPVDLATIAALASAHGVATAISAQVSGASANDGASAAGASAAGASSAGAATAGVATAGVATAGVAAAGDGADGRGGGARRRRGQQQHQQQPPSPPSSLAGGDGSGTMRDAGRGSSRSVGGGGGSGRS